MNWLNKIEEKSTFIVFDVKNFYRLISRYLLQKARLQFAKTKVSITKEEEKIIYHSRKCRLFKDQET